MVGRVARPLDERLLERRSININNCWEWVGALNNKGYGVMSNPRLPGKNKMRVVSRIAYEVWIGPIPDNLFVLHHCDNPKCFNPDHLFVGTQKDNLRDAAKKGRIRNRYSDIVECPKGHNDWYTNPNTNKRYCRVCYNANKKKYYDEQRSYALSNRTFKLTPKLEKR